MLPIPELLAPRGPERLEYALRYGADAVYAGLTEFGMRAAPIILPRSSLPRGGMPRPWEKLYLTLNTLPTNRELERLPAAIREAWAAGADALLWRTWAFWRW